VGVSLRASAPLKEICLSDRLSYQSVIGKRRGIDCAAGQIKEELVFVPASVEAARSSHRHRFGSPGRSDRARVPGALENTVLREVNKAKRKAIRDDTVDSAEALEAELQDVFVLNNKITKTEERLVRQVDAKCAVLQVPPSEVFPGECGEGDPILREVEVCVVAAARCEACLKINAFDALTLNCDLRDDRMANMSCSVSPE